MKRNQIVIITIILFLIIGGTVCLSVLLKEKSQFEGKSFKTGEGPSEEVFSLLAKVSSVDFENNFLMVKPSGKENEVKVVLSDTTKLIKLESPFDPDNPPEPGTQFTPKQIEITLEDFKEGDSVFIKAKENIAGKSEFNNVDFVHILP